MKIVVENVNFQSTDGINCVSGVIYKPDTPDHIKGIVQIIHGMAEHIGRYDDFARFLCANSYIACGCDHIGHGKSVKSADDYGYFGHINGCSTMMDDARKFGNIVRAQYPHPPFFILGHSMGSFVLRKYITKYCGDIAGVIISGTGGPNPLAKIGINLAVMDVRKNGDRHRSKFLDNMAFGNYNKLIKHPKTKFDWLTRDTEIVDKYVHDDACGYIFTSSAFADMLRIMYDVNTDSWYTKVPKTLPILMISGTKDPVGDYGKGVKLVYKKLQDSGLQQIKLILYGDGRHEMLNELNRDEVYDDLVSWMDEKILEEKQCRSGE